MPMVRARTRFAVFGGARPSYLRTLFDLIGNLLEHD